MFFKKYLIFFISIFFLFQKLEAQIVLPAEALKELESKNITEDELRARLLEQDVDLDKLKPADAPRVKGTIEAVIKELEAKKKEAKDTESDEVKTAEKPKKVTNLPPAADTVKQTVMVMVKNDSVKKVEIWGQQIFKNKYLKMFQNGEDVRPADNYVLGTGDKISVNIWGNARFSASQDISPDGYVQFDRLPRIFLKGTTYGKAKEIIFSRFSQYYPFSKDQFSVTLAYQRSVTVNIVGEVENSGSFTMSAQNTAFNAIVASGGPSNIGSVRNIQLVRAGQKPRRLDVYEFIKNPSAENDFFLQSNDYISVPVAERVVSIQGAVQRPYKYELIKGENLMQLIDFAGGLQDSAYQSNIQIVRFVEDQERILDVNLRELKKNKGDFELLNGDRIVIKVIPKTYENFAEVTGDRKSVV